MSEGASIILEKYTNLCFNESTECQLNDKCTFITFPKNKIVLFQGETTKSLYFIITGLVRSYYIDKEGNDITKSFATENDFFGTKGLLGNNPSLFNVECLEECECIQIPYTVIKSLMEKNEEVYKYFSQYIITALENLEIRTRDLLMKSAKDRYKIFMEQYPNLEKRVQQKYIASYIGIRSGSLSRIKSRI